MDLNDAVHIDQVFQLYSIWFYNFTLIIMTASEGSVGGEFPFECPDEGTQQGSETSTLRMILH